MRIYVIWLLFFISKMSLARFDVLFQREVCCDRIIITTEKPLGAVVIAQAPYEDAVSVFRVFVPFGSITKQLEQVLSFLNKNSHYGVRVYSVKKPLKGIMIDVSADPSEYICLLKHDYEQNFSRTIIEIQNRTALTLVLEHCVDYRYA